jgi:2'-hydroxyisoflavone reductase
VSRSGAGMDSAVRDVLVLGGTAWIGRLVTERLVARGDRVTCLARGTGGSAPAGSRFVAADRDRPDAYDEVAGADWDEVVDLTSSAEQASAAVAALAERAGHWTLVAPCPCTRPSRIRAPTRRRRSWIPSTSRSTGRPRWRPSAR